MDTQNHVLMQLNHIMIEIIGIIDNQKGKKLGKYQIIPEKNISKIKKSQIN